MIYNSSSATCRHKVVDDCPMSQNRQPLCIDGGTNLSDLDDKNIPKVNKHHYGLASPPVVPFILEKPTNCRLKHTPISIFNQGDNSRSNFYLARAHSSSFHLTMTSWFLTKASGRQSCFESANFSFSRRLNVLKTSRWLSSWKYTWNKQCSCRHG